MEAKALATRVADLALEKKGSDIQLLDIRGLSDVADFFVIISGESDVHVKTLANNISKSLRNDEGIRLLHKEGFIELKWVLLDYVDVVVHIFTPETRDHYALEKLWADAKITKVEDDATSAVISE